MAGSSSPLNSKSCSFSHLDKKIGASSLSFPNLSKFYKQKTGFFFFASLLLY